MHFSTGCPPDEPGPSSRNDEESEQNDDAVFAEALRKSKEDFERTETLRKQQEDADLQKAINESLRSASSTSSCG